MPNCFSKLVNSVFGNTHKSCLDRYSHENKADGNVGKTGQTTVLANQHETTQHQPISIRDCADHMRQPANQHTVSYQSHNQCSYLHCLPSIGTIFRSPKMVFVALRFKNNYCFLFIEARISKAL